MHFLIIVLSNCIKYEKKDKVRNMRVYKHKFNGEQELKVKHVASKYYFFEGCKHLLYETIEL